MNGRMFTVWCALVALGLAVFAQPQFAGAQETSQARAEKDIIEYINQQIRQGWVDNEISPSGKATDGEWVRRVYLDILGRIPRYDETQKFLVSKQADRKERLIDELLNSEDYIEEYARNWTTIWSNILIGRAGGGDRSMADKTGLQQYLRRAFLRNKPYDRIVTELVTATGNSTPGEEGYNGAVNFLLNEIDNAVPANERTARATAKVAKIFLGLQVQCTQCHNHPFNDWKQNQFWSMDAFLRQIDAPTRTRRGAAANLGSRDFAGESGDTDLADVFYEKRNGELKVAYPTFVDGTRIDPNGRVSQVDRRAELAKLICHSEWMGKALVNRMWGHFLGYGFTKPVDDMGPHNLPSHPELLDTLGKEFGYSFDIKQVIRWITLSEAYGLSSKFGAKNAIDDPDVGETPLFSHFYLRQMRAEELYQSLITATEAGGGGDFEAQQRAKSQWLGQFINAFGTDEGGESTTFNGTIPQNLMMMQGGLVKNATQTSAGTFLGKVAASNLKSRQKIEYLYLAGLSRKPRRLELEYANALWQQRGSEAGALQDIFWAILNTNEFIFNH